MSDDVETPPQARTHQLSNGSAPGYVSPRIERLGTVSELTRGGVFESGDTVCGAGQEGSL